jgi:hypothetical protein
MALQVLLREIEGAAGTWDAIPAIASAASGTNAHQSARQPNATVSSPPSSGPTRFEAPALAPQIPSAEPRRSGGKPLTAPASAAGLTIPAATPCTARVSSRTTMSGATAPPAAPAANSRSPASATRRGPSRSTNLPDGQSVSA